MNDPKNKRIIGEVANTDVANNVSVTSPTSLPNSLRLKTPESAQNRQNMSSILQRLPLIRQINATQNSTLKYQPIWLTWCLQTQKRHGSLALKLNQYATLTSFKHGTIEISCKNTGSASLIKHQQNSLLNALHDAGFDEINRIKVHMSPAKTSTKTSNKYATSQGSQRPKPSDSAVESIEATQSLIENEQLAASLRRLALTLKY